MSIEKAFSFVFEDEDWVKKVALGALWMLGGMFIVPIFVVLGYGIAIARNVRDDMDMPLPEWDGWREFLGDGFALGAAQFIYALPAIVLFLVGGISAAVSGSSDLQGPAMFASGIFILLACVGGLWMLAMIVISPALYIQYLEYGTFSACMQVRDVLQIARDHLGQLLMAALIIFGAQMLLSLGGAIPCLGIFITLAAYPYVTMVSGHIYGQLATDILDGGSKADKFDDIMMPDDGMI